MYIDFLIKSIRKEQNVSLKKLEKMTNISTSHLNDIENNLKQPTLIVTLKIAKALNKKIEDIYRVHNE